MPPLPRQLALQTVFEDWVASRPGRGARSRDGTLSAASAQLYRDMWAVFMIFLLSRPKRRGSDLTGLSTLRPRDLEAFVSEGPRLHGSGGPWSDRYTWRMLHLIDRVLSFHRRRELTQGAVRNEGRISAAAEILRDTPVRYANASHLDGHPEPLTTTQARRLRRHLETTLAAQQRMPLGTSWKLARDHAAVAVMLGAGLAPGDVQALPLSALPRLGPEHQRDPGSPVWLDVPADGLSPAHRAPLASWACPVLAHWVQVRQQCGIAGEMAFPSTSKGSPLSRMSCHRRVVAVLDAADVGGGVPFRLRHTCAVTWLRAGHQEEQVGQWLGLVEPKALRRYLGIAQRVIAR